MASKFIVFVALASLAQLAVVRSEDDSDSLFHQALDSFDGETDLLFSLMDDIANGDHSTFDTKSSSAMEKLIAGVDYLYDGINTAQNGANADNIQSAKEAYPDTASKIIENFVGPLQFSSDASHDQVVQNINNNEEALKGAILNERSSKLAGLINYDNSLSDDSQAQFDDVMTQMTDALKAFVEAVCAKARAAVDAAFGSEASDSQNADSQSNEEKAKQSLVHYVELIKEAVQITTNGDSAAVNAAAW